MRICSCLLVALSFFHLAHADKGWTKKKGKGYFKLETRSLFGRSLLNENGEALSITPHVYLGVLSLYGAYGITDFLEISCNVPFVYNQVTDISHGISSSTQRTTSLGDASLGLRYGLLRDQPFVLSAAVDVGFPMGYNEDDPLEYTQTGTGVWRGSASIGFGYATTDRWYVKGGVDHSRRSGGYSSTVGAELGGGHFFMSRRLLLSAGVWGTFSLRDGAYENPTQRFTVYANDTEYVAFGLSGAYFVVPETLGLSLGADGAFMGRNILASPSFYASIFYNL